MQKDNPYVPGHWRCPECHFLLVQSYVDHITAVITERYEPGGNCPNDGNELEPYTWRQAFHDLQHRVDLGSSLTGFLEFEDGDVMFAGRIGVVVHYNEVIGYSVQIRPGQWVKYMPGGQPMDQGVAIVRFEPRRINDRGYPVTKSPRLKPQ